MRGFALCLALTAASLGGCAHVEIDADGTTRIVGLVYVEIPPTAGASPGVRTTSLGLSVLRTELATGITLGYHNHGVIALGADVCTAPAELVHRWQPK